MIELVVLGLSGTLVGAGMGATKRRAPVLLALFLYGLGAAFFVLAALAREAGH